MHAHRAVRGDGDFSHLGAGRRRPFGERDAAALARGQGRPPAGLLRRELERAPVADRKSTRLNSSHGYISYAVFCLKKKNRVQLIVREPLTALQYRRIQGST